MPLGFWSKGYLLTSSMDHLSESWNWVGLNLNGLLRDDHMVAC